MPLAVPNAALFGLSGGANSSGTPSSQAGTVRAQVSYVVSIPFHWPLCLQCSLSQCPPAVILDRSKPRSNRYSVHVRGPGLSTNLRASLPAAQPQSASSQPDTLMLSSMASGAVLHEAFSHNCELTYILCPRAMAHRRVHIVTHWHACYEPSRCVRIPQDNLHIST